MEKFFRQIRILEMKGGKRNPFPFFKTAYHMSQKAVVRELERRGLLKPEVDAAKRFLKIGGYSKKGTAKEGIEGHLFQTALKLRETKKAHILEDIKQAAQHISSKAGIAGLKELARNTAVQIYTNAESAQVFLNREPRMHRYITEDIQNSIVSEKDKKKLLRYLRKK